MWIAQKQQKVVFFYVKVIKRIKVNLKSQRRKWHYFSASLEIFGILANLHIEHNSQDIKLDQVVAGWNTNSGWRHHESKYNDGFPLLLALVQITKHQSSGDDYFVSGHWKIQLTPNMRVVSFNL